MAPSMFRLAARGVLSTMAGRAAQLMLVAGVTTAAGCERAPARGPSDVTTTSGEVPAPGSVPPPSRTVDSAGFVDNAGRTANEDARTAMSGMRATEAGSQRLTGTPGSGLPIPIGPKVRPPPPGEAPGEPAPGTETGPSTPLEAAVQSVATMMCTHATSCGRVGDGKRWRSGQDCIHDLSPDVYRELASAECPYDFDVDAVSACVSSLRSRSCDQAIGMDALASTPACAPRSLCLAR